MATMGMTAPSADADERLSRLRDMLKQHALHLSGRGGKPINAMMSNLTNVVLENFDLSSAKLLACNFSYSSLARSSFRGAVLTNSLFIRSNLASADFSKADLGGVRFLGTDASDATLDGARLEQGIVQVLKATKDGDGRIQQEMRRFAQETELSNSNFEGASLKNVVMKGCTVRGSNFRNADFAGATLADSDFSGSVFRGANMSGASVANVVVENAVFDITPTTLALFEGDAQFRRILDHLVDIRDALDRHGEWVASGGSKGRRADFAGHNLRGADLAGRAVAALSFAGADLSGAKMTRAVFAAADFSNALIQYADLTGADLRGANFTGATIRFSRLSQVNADDLKLISGGSLRTRFDGATIENCDLGGQGIREALATAKLERCSFEGE